MMMWLRSFVVIGVVAAVARSQPDTKLEFDVASIKPNHSGRQGFDGFEVRHGALTVRNVSLKTLIEAAYHTQAERIIGGPAWLASDRFDVVAKGRVDATKDQVWLMLQSLLSDRFKLILRSDVRDLPFYALEIAKDVTKLPKGSELKCGPPAVSDPSSPLLVTPCGSLMTAWGPRGGVVIGDRVSAADLADELSGFAGRPVLDRSGFKGSLNVNLEWTPEGYAVRGVADNEARRSTQSLEPGPSLFTAIQEQLGLKLVARKGPIEVVVIETAEKPSGN